jgi:SAM-dependent methyltransferase
MISSNMFICPCCSSNLLTNNNELYCGNDQCSKKEFYKINNKPVLIDFTNSILKEDTFLKKSGSSIVKRRKKNLPFFKRIILGENKFTKGNIKQLSTLLSKITNPKILIVGGGEVGSGLEYFVKQFDRNILSFDIYDSENVDFIADGHSIPIISNYFDLVICQAVLEHVLNPNMVVSEITRVLKLGGVVYAETPFMQQVHEGAFDFTRFSESGHRYLFKNFATLKSGYTKGAGSTLLWALTYFATGIFRTRLAGKSIRICFFWLRFFDSCIPYKYNIDSACGVFFLGKKNQNIIADKDIISHYLGSQK